MKNKCIYLISDSSIVEFEFESNVKESFTGGRPLRDEIEFLGLYKSDDSYRLFFLTSKIGFLNITKIQKIIKV